MNKLLTFPGLQLIYLGDIDFMQESVRESFALLLRGLTGQEKPDCMLIEPTPDADGVICIEGEIMPCKFYNGSVSQKLSYRVESQYAGDRTFKDGTNHLCHETRYAVGYNAPLLGSPGFPAFSDLLFSSVKMRTGVNAVTNDNAKVQIDYAFLGDLYHIDGKVDILDDVADLQIIVEDMKLGIPGSLAENSPKYFAMTAEIDGVLVNIPAKMNLTYNDASSCLVKITINKTAFKMDSSASFSFTLTK